ncbi:patatin-like phospholipase family protein [Haloimpatiens massiliensis]|uniref:patatin-like phospholipase family protein n=1 Tax=Haloimpatiens massiliensis TaxID=1658110 RepID=UPI0015E13F23|nr:patatin-like phospholipase family protein [Haloimpatiens massiliensis]
MSGLFLQGGGAKGAFQAGALYALWEKGVKLRVIAGTSIGAVNGYYLYTENLEAMKEFYTNSGEQGEALLNKKIKLNKVVDNSIIMNILNELKGNNAQIKAFYVNYVEVMGINIKEKVVNICNLQQEQKLDAVKFSSLLPYVSHEQEEKNFKQLWREFVSGEQIEKFKECLISGEYHGYNLDGGVLNNCFLTPFVENKVEKLYLMPLSNNFVIPEYIKEEYKEEDIVLINREKGFNSHDTLNFQPDFLKELFYEGYHTCIEKLNLNSSFASYASHYGEIS